MSPNVRFFVPTAVSLWDAEQVNGLSQHVWFPPWSLEEVWWCGGALLVTLPVISLEFKAHLTAEILHPIWFALGEWWSAASDDLASTVTQPQPSWDLLGWAGPQSEGKAANKCPTYVETPSRLLENHSGWSWLRECQECAKLSSRQTGATLKNLFNTFLLTTWFHMYYLIILISSLFFYNVENSKNKEKPLIE